MPDAYHLAPLAQQEVVMKADHEILPEFQKRFKERHPARFVTGLLLFAGLLSVCAVDLSAASRAADLQAQRHALEQSLQHPAPAESVAGLAAIAKNHGMTGRPYLFRLDDIPSVLNNRPLHPSAMDAIQAFAKILKARGTDLIVMPIPSQVICYGHEALSGVNKEHCLTPAFSKSLLTLLDNGIEVLDLRSAYRTAQPKDGLSVMHAGDHHWSSGGMGIAAQLLAKRLQRYGFPSQDMTWQVNLKTIGLQTSLLGKNRMWSARKKKGIAATKAEVLKLAGLPSQEVIQQFKLQAGAAKIPVPLFRLKSGGNKGGGAFSPYVAVIGDSMAYHMGHSPMGGSGFANHLAHALKMPVSFYGKSGGANSVVRVFSEELAQHASWPRVIVLIGRISPYADKVWPMPVEPGAKQEQGAALAGTVAVKLSEVAAVPDPDTVVYKDAVLTAKATITTGAHTGRSIKVLHWAMQDRQLHPHIKKWTNGAVLKLKLTSWDQAKKNIPGIDTINTLDEVTDIMLPQYWAQIAP